MSFKYDPIELTGLTMQILLEKKYNTSDDEENEYPKSLRYAIFEFLRTMTSDEIEELLHEYVDTENVEAITLEEHDIERLEHYLLKTKRLADLRWKFQQDGTDGMGVLDLSRKTFTGCAFVQHGDTLKAILKEHHGAYGEAYEYIMFGGRVEYAGVRAVELIAYIRKNFKFIDTQRPVESLEPAYGIK